MTFNETMEDVAKVLEAVGVAASRSSSPPT